MIDAKARKSVASSTNQRPILKTLNDQTNKPLILFFLAGGVMAGLYLILSPFSAAVNEGVVKQTGGIPKAAGAVSMEKPDSSREISPNQVQFQNSSASTEVSNLVQQIRNALHSGDLAERDRASNGLLPELIKINPNVAAALCESLSGDGPEREEMLRRLAQYWAATHVTDAKRWAEQLSNESERNVALVYVCAQIGQADPQLAVQMADEYGLEKQSEPVLTDLVYQWAERDFSGALAWVHTRPAGEKRNEMLSRLAVLLARTSPEEAAQIVARQIPEGRIQTETAISVLYQWARRDSAGAHAWVELFPKGPLRERALKELWGIRQNKS